MTKYVRLNHVQLRKYKSFSEFETFKKNDSETFIQDHVRVGKYEMFQVRFEPISEPDTF